MAAFQEGLKEAGYVEDKNIRIDYRFAEGDIDRLPTLAKELVSDGVKVIAAGGPPSVSAAAAATSTIPIVAAGFGDVENLSRPQGNITGFSTLENAAMQGKRLELLRELLPQHATVVVLIHPNNPGGTIRGLADVARPLGITLSAMTPKSDAEIAAAFEAAAEQRAGAILVTGAPFFTVRHENIAALAARHHLPAIYPWREYVQAGGLISYGSSITAVWRGAGRYVAKILSGAKPGDLPVQQPSTFDLAINLRTAKTLGIDIPAPLLAIADEVIE